MKTAITTDKAPKAIGPYAQAIVHNGLAYLSGQIPIDPATGQLVEGGIGEQTEQVLRNIRGLLEACGSSIDKVVKTTVFLKDMDEFGAMNEVFARHFSASPPARSTVEAARLPRDVRVEIDAIAVV